MVWWVLPDTCVATDTAYYVTQELVLMNKSKNKKKRVETNERYPNGTNPWDTARHGVTSGSTRENVNSKEVLTKRG